MTTIPATTLSQELFERGTVRENSEFSRGLCRDWLVLRVRPLIR